ncbi:hypothetical protein M758_3G242200 [Ceratodon purpureus]|uniref:Uncharacterized protein n=1 Tax=Ceratodon purpureus TaxID=3225 RepID=A0A8T0IQF3_CERPU|nr:hypothetical protein KC19_3G238100 [Ceratodon purpureus]KAG0624355.1 hypothetical protein M758_3G242200 [Ceratodon purpureus]
MWTGVVLCLNLLGLVNRDFLCLCKKQCCSNRRFSCWVIMLHLILNPVFG